MISSIACSPPASAPFTSPLSNEANGSFVFHSGCCGASVFTRSSAKNNWKYIGCSHQSVPSLSKVAIRSGGGTKSGEPSFVTFSTKSIIDFFAAPSFHEGRGPVPSEVEGSCARAMVVISANALTSATAKRFLVWFVFIVFFSASLFFHIDFHLP